MKIADLRRAVEQAVRERALGTVADTSSVQAFSQLLADYEDLTVEEFCVKAREGLQKKAKQKKATATKPAEPASANTVVSLVNESAIGRYIGELHDTKGDSRQFETVVARMKKDKDVRIAEAREIAKRFMGSSHPYKTKPEAAKAILQRQITDVRAAGKAEHISDIF
jgi:hypothetical protein